MNEVSDMLETIGVEIQKPNSDADQGQMEPVVVGQEPPASSNVQDAQEPAQEQKQEPAQEVQGQVQGQEPAQQVQQVQQVQAMDVVDKSAQGAMSYQELMAINESLRKELVKAVTGPVAPTPDGEKKGEGEKQEQPVQQPIQQQVQHAQGVQRSGPIEFVATEEELDKMLDSKDGFNTFMTGVVEYVTAVAYEKLMGSGREQLLRDIPSMVMNITDQQVALRNVIGEFYNKNGDLVPYSSFVGYVANEIAAKEPGLSLQGLVGKLGPEVRMRLGLNKGVQNAQVQNAQAQNVQQSPGFPPSGTPARGGGQSGPTGITKEILDTIL